MTVREDITVSMQQYVDEHRDCETLSPAAVAVATFEKFKGAKLDPHIEYSSLEHLKNMARKVLARNFGSRGKDDAVFSEEDDLFSGFLQERYPLPCRRGDDPVYKLRSLLTTEERGWNVNVLRKCGNAYLSHADALEADGMGVAEQAA